jgi:hypothetical protein
VRFDWWQLLPAIFLLVWIINSIVRGGDDERNGKKNRPTPRGDRQPSDRSARRPMTDIDRFLDEVNRRRRQAVERQSGRSATDSPPVIPTVSQPPRPQTRTVPRRTPAAPPPVRVPAVRTVERRPSQIEPLSVIAVEAVASAARSLPTQGPAPQQPAPPVPGALPIESSGQGLTQIVNLLVTPNSLQTAVILHEVFGPPLSRRRSVRSGG